MLLTKVMKFTPTISQTPGSATDVMAPNRRQSAGEEISICCPAQRRHQSGKAAEAGLGIEDNQTGGTR